MSLWPSSQASDASDASVTSMAPEVEAGQILSSSTSSYFVLEFIGEGCFGKVARCQKLETKEVVAVKILKDFYNIDETVKELSMLEQISVLNPDHTNLVKFFERFDYMGNTCLAFEMLDGSLYDLLPERSLNLLSVKEIRPIAQQLLVALDALKGLGVLHTDIKPDNVMLVNMQDQPFRVKLIDFGGAISVADVHPGLVVQPAGYRAPEVALGLPFTESIDVWGLGCVLAYLYLADHLFPFICVYQMMKRIVEVLGQPEDHLLCAGKYTEYFFIQEEAADGPAWRLKTPDEYADANDLILLEEDSDAYLPSSLDDLINVYPRENADEFEDRVAFIDLLKQLLHPVGDQRISPHQALQHSFITMSHLTEHSCSSDYLTTSRSLMSVCSMEDRMNTTAATTGSSSYEDPATRSEGALSNATYVIESSDCFSDEGMSDATYDIEPSDCSSDEGMSDATYGIEPSDCSSDEGMSDATYDIESSDCSSDEGISDVTYEIEPSDCSSDEGMSDATHDIEPSDCSSDEGISDVTYDIEPSDCSSDEGISDVTCDIGPSDRSSDGHSSPSDNLADWTFHRVRPPWLKDEDPAAKSSNVHSLSSDDDLVHWSFQKVRPPWLKDEDPAASSSDGAKTPDRTAAASASSGLNLLKSIRKFFSRVARTFSCCCHPTVED